jgi:hypothetical protein
MDRALFGDEPQIALIILIIFIASLFLTSNFTFSVVLLKGCPFVCNWGNPLVMCHRLLATLWQICNRASEVIGNFQTSSQKGIGNFCKSHTFARGLPTSSIPWPEFIAYPPEQLSEGIR